METFLITAYILMWPLITLTVLAVLARGVVKDYRAARKSGNTVV
ncbi:putative transporter small subunit [Saccharomonospora cyanea]|uniref:Uncharacterized protein n=1 Tax=Saccharomonospora cyanea NA-134 TaxID=882082 RepID=H5XIL2_9PSEU|nr:putative transporter small subunit [Saccharomonospora cyanea]EHR62873.1 hypothetical protein SaccyDRAFT_4052 [Saccharomonospora cyanea NA-134]